MIILGIDPGSRKAGYAVIKSEGRKLSYITSGVMRYDKIEVFIDRLGEIYDSCKELVDEHNPTQISLESLVYVKNVSSLTKLSQARGAMIAAFMSTHREKVFEYSPTMVKSTVTGHGHASKDAVDKSLSMMFGKIKYKTHDESDALAIAVCHALNKGMNSLNDKKVSKVKGYSKGRSLKSVFESRLK